MKASKLSKIIILLLRVADTRNEHMVHGLEHYEFLPFCKCHDLGSFALRARRLLQQYMLPRMKCADGPFKVKAVGKLVEPSMSRNLALFNSVTHRDIDSVDIDIVKQL